MQLIWNKSARIVHKWGKILPRVNKSTTVWIVTILGGLINVWGGMSCNRQRTFKSKDSWEYKLRRDFVSPPRHKMSHLSSWRRKKIPANHLGGPWQQLYGRCSSVLYTWMRGSTKHLMPTWNASEANSNPDRQHINFYLNMVDFIQRFL